MMTPKSLCCATSWRSARPRNSPPAPVSTAFCGTTPNTAIRIPSWSPTDKIKRVVMCSGKVYYDLLEERDARGIDDVYHDAVRTILSFPRHFSGQRARAVQERRNGVVSGRAQEPGRLGHLSNPIWNGFLSRIKAKHTRPRYVGRATSASPATGLASQHKAQQTALVNDALTIEGN